MAIEQTDTQSFTTAGRFQDVTIPSSGNWDNGSSTLESGDLLIILYHAHEANDYEAVTPTGWNASYDIVDQNMRFSCYYKTSDGTEGGTTVTVQHQSGESASSEATAIVLHVKAWNALESAGTPAFSAGNSSQPDPPSISPSWGAKDGTIFIAHACQSDNDGSVTSYPADYTNNNLEVTQGAGADDLAFQAMASRTNNVTTEDPGAFTFTAADRTIAQTIAIEPSGGSSATMDVSNDISYGLSDATAASASMSVSQGISYDMTDSGTAQAVQSISNAITYGQSVSFGNISTMSVSIGASTYDLTASGTAQATASVVNDLVLDLSHSMTASAVMSVSNDIAYTITVATQTAASMGITADYSLDISVSTSEITATITVSDSRTISFKVQDRTIVMPDQDRIIKITS